LRYTPDAPRSAIFVTCLVNYMTDES